MKRISVLVSASLITAAIGLCAIDVFAQTKSASSQDPQDPAAAREQLKTGYRLKKEGKYAEALPHLLESLRLHSQVKTLMNIADCQEHLLQFAEAQNNWVLARDHAALQGQRQARLEAESRLAALEARMPRLVVTLEADAPEGTQVERDGVLLGEVSLGTALPLDPGKHTISVSAPGHENRAYEVTLAERDQVRLVVAPGPAKPSSEPTAAAGPAEPEPVPVAATVQATSPAAAVPQDQEQDPFWGPQRIAAAGLAGLGVVGLVVSGIEWSVAQNKNEDAISLCDPWCDQEAQSKHDSAKSALVISRWSLGLGVAFEVAAAALWFTAPRPSSEPPVDRRVVRLRPVIGPGALAINGYF